MAEPFEIPEEGLGLIIVGKKAFKVMNVYCCRNWTVLTTARISTCGYCGRVPQPR